MIYIYIPARDRWCAVRAAHPRRGIVTVCRAPIGYTPVFISTFDPGDRTCPGCRIQLAPAPAPVVAEPIVEAEPEPTVVVDHDELRDAVATELQHTHIFGVSDGRCWCGLTAATAAYGTEPRTRISAEPERIAMAELDASAIYEGWDLSAPGGDQ